MEPLFIDELDGPTFDDPDDATAYRERDTEEESGWSCVGGWIA